MQQSSRILRQIIRQRFPPTRVLFRSGTPFALQTTRFAPISVPQRSLQYARYNSSLVVPESEQNAAPPRSPQPAYQLTFTCKPCSHRSSHTITKHGYHKGTVLIKCPNCHNRHVISDHLQIFMDEKSNLEDILRRKAGPGGDISRLLKKGRLGQRDGELVGREGEEDIEFWEDGSETSHKSDTP